MKINFGLAAARNANEVWDLDNLVKPTLDAMEGYSGHVPSAAYRNQPMTE